MNKYKEKIGNIINKIKGNKRILYLTFCIVLILSCLVLNVTFSFMTQNKNINSANITVGDLKYKMIINEVELNESVGTKLPTNTIIGDRIILLKAGKTEQFEIILTSLNSIDTKYEVTYKVCSDQNCTDFVNTPSTVQLFYHIETPYVSGTLAADNAKSIRIITNNSANVDYYVQINLNVGYIHNELVQTKQIGTSYTPGSVEGNLKVLAVVDGIEVDTFPTEPNYEVNVNCTYNNNSQSAARGIFRYSTEKGWEIDVFGVNKQLTTCRVEFTKIQLVTYEILANHYDCANLEAAVKSSDPIIKYTGNCSLIQDTANADGTHTWRMKLLSNGTLSVSGLIYIDAFLVGGGAGGSETTGGAGGYTKTQKNIRLDNKTSGYAITIGAGGAKSGGSGGATSAFGYSVSGATTRAGGSGGSSGDVGGTSPAGGSYGNNGSGNSKGNGQGTTTCEFGEGTLAGCTRGTSFAYAGGGGAGAVIDWGSSVGGAGGVGGGGRGGCANGTANTGGGGGGWNTKWYNDQNKFWAQTETCAGGSGVVVIRDVRT